MSRKATDSVTTISIHIGKNSFHLICLDVRFGSKADIPRHPVERPLLGGKRTSNVRF